MSHYINIVQDHNAIEKCLRKEGYSEDAIDNFFNIFGSIEKNEKDFENSLFRQFIENTSNAIYFRHPLIGLKIALSRNIYFIFELVERRDYPLYEFVLSQFKVPIQEALKRKMLVNSKTIWETQQHFWTDSKSLN
jgi:hypothetical protein